MTDPVGLQDVRWHVLPEVRQVLLGPQGLRLEEWRQQGRLNPIKHGTNRTIYRVDLPGLSFYLKHYPLADLRSWFRQLVRPSKARTEYDHALEVARRGVPTFFPLAYGERPTLLGPAESFLITRTLAETEPLNQFLDATWPALPPPRQTRIASRLARALGRLLADMHQAGVWHNDLHAGNLLIRLDPGDDLSLFLIDLHAVSLHPPLEWAASRDNLIMLNRWFSLRVNRSDRLRFWLSYCAGRDLGGRFPAWCPEIGAGRTPDGNSRALHAYRLALARDLERATLESNINFWHRRDQRCLENNRYYRRVRKPGFTGHVVNHLDAGFLAELLADPDALLDRPGVRLLKKSRTSTVAEVEVPQSGRPRTMILKRFQVRSWGEPLASLFRPAPALRSWMGGHAFGERFLPTPRPLAVLHRVRGGLHCQGYLLTEKIDQARDLRQFVDFLRTLPVARGRRLKHVLVQELARLLRDMHRRRLSHRDLKASNVLVRLDDPSLSVWFIDLVGVVRFRRLKRSRRIQNLARLHTSFVRDPFISRSDKLRFLRTYLEWNLQGRADWKNWWRKIDRATGKKIARNIRLGRPLA